MAKFYQPLAHSEYLMAVAFLFPGQGSQHPGMLHTLTDHPEVERTLTEVSEALKRDVKELDSEKALQSTVSVQLAIFTAGVAVARALQSMGIQPEALAGLSVGSFAAAVISGALPLVDAITLVKQRSELMEQLFAEGYGLSAIVGLDERKVKALLAEVCSSEAPVYIANINAPRQIVIAGSNAGMQAVIDGARASGARKAERLHVSVPSHCPLLNPVALALEASLLSMHLGTPQITYISNTHARPLRTAGAISCDLSTNIASSVRWHDTTVVLKELGCKLFLEMNPGRVLSDLVNENIADVRSVALEFSSLS
ncbi:MAG: malonate decarboxylase subunit epsilon [Candidatus Melainabacteria bacterium]|nr:malonate decarboxylase subunit epsilon [Candidatus Melainabacteria bacterium]